MQIQCALANTDIDGQELLNYLIEKIPTASFLRLTPPPEVVMNAAFDWRGVLHDAAAIITLGSVLWSAYTKFVEPLIESGEKPNAGLFFQLKDINGKSYQVMLGKQFKDKEIFIKNFEQKITTMTVENDEGKTEKIVEELENSGCWIKIK